MGLILSFAILSGHLLNHCKDELKLYNSSLLWNDQAAGSELALQFFGLFLSLPQF